MNTQNTENIKCRYCDKEFEYYEKISHQCDMRYTKITSTLLETIELLNHASTLNKIDRNHYREALEHLAETHELIIKGFKKQKE